MPKVTVVVDKDETGKIWNYNLTQENLGNLKDLFATNSLSIHKPEIFEKSSKTSS